MTACPIKTTKSVISAINEKLVILKLPMYKIRNREKY